MSFCCPYHRDGGLPYLGCVNPFAQQLSPPAKCECDQIGASMRGTLLCPMQYTEEQNIEVLKDMLLDSGFNVSRRQKHAIDALLKDRERIGKEIQDALLSELFPVSRGQLFPKMDELKNRLLKK